MLFRFLFLLASVRITAGAEILAAIMPLGHSHVGSIVPVLDELVRQGHNVTMYMEQYGEAIDFGPRFKRWYISIIDHPNPIDDYQVMHLIWYLDTNPQLLTLDYNSSSVSCNYVVTEHRSELKRIIAYPWDLILTDSLFSTCGYGIALLSKANHIIMHTTTVEGFCAITKGFGRQHITAPPFYMDTWNPEFNVRHFFDRLAVAYEIFGMWYWLGTIANGRMRESLEAVVANFDYLSYCGSAAMSFTDMPLQLYVPESLNNELFSYGAYCKPFGELQGELVDFVDDSRSNGTILLAFGTVVPFGDAPLQVREAFVEALNQLTDYRIIWACRGCPEMGLKKHVRVSEWVPQTNLLNHPKTKLFITHGGLKSLKEAVCAQMPTLFMPVFGDQPRNSWLAKHHGFGQIINRFNVTGSYLLNSIREMLNNPSYKERAEKVQSFFEDAPIPAVKEAAFRFNRLLKYGGRLPEYFYTRCTNFSYIRHLNLDLILMILSVIGGLLMIK